jgi:hypothetical protein
MYRSVSVAIVKVGTFADCTTRRLTGRGDRRRLCYLRPQMLADRSRGLAATAALALALVSCASDLTESVPPDEDPGPELALYPNRATHDALVAGRLTRAGRCVFLVGSDGTTYGLAWPAGRTAWDSVTSEIVLGDARAAIGEEVWIGGGPTALNAQRVSDPRWEWVHPPRADCLGGNFWIASSISTEEP